MAGRTCELSARRIRDRLAPSARARLSELTVLGEVDSTNSHLVRLPAAQRHAHAVLADAQTSGRGRRQRSWYSPAGANIYLSLGWSLRTTQPVWSAIPLVVAVCVCRALARAGLRGHGIKWPNDIRVGQRKLAGILVESQSTGNGPPTAVIGVGLNVCMESRDPYTLRSISPPIDQPWTDLATELGAGHDVDRNEMAARLLEELLHGLDSFEEAGWPAFRADWERLDQLAGRRVRLDGNEPIGSARALGVDDRGGLRLEVDGRGAQVVHSAEVSVRDD